MVRGKALIAEKRIYDSGLQEKRGMYIYIVTALCSTFPADLVKSSLSWPIPQSGVSPNVSFLRGNEVKPYLHVRGSENFYMYAI